MILSLLTLHTHQHWLLYTMLGTKYFLKSLAIDWASRALFKYECLCIQKWTLFLEFIKH